MPGSRHRRPAGRHDPRLCRSGANKRCLFRAVYITFDDPGLDPLAPPQGGATPSLAPSSKVAKSRSVIAGAGFVTRTCTHRPRRTLAGIEAGCDWPGQETNGFLCRYFAGPVYRDLDLDLHSSVGQTRSNHCRCRPDFAEVPAQHGPARLEVGGVG